MATAPKRESAYPTWPSCLHWFEVAARSHRSRRSIVHINLIYIYTTIDGGLVAYQLVLIARGDVTLLHDMDREPGDGLLPLGERFHYITL